MASKSAVIFDIAHRSVSRIMGSKRKIRPVPRSAKRASTEGLDRGEGSIRTCREYCSLVDIKKTTKTVMSEQNRVDLGGVGRENQEVEKHILCVNSVLVGGSCCLFWRFPSVKVTPRKLQLTTGKFCALKMFEEAAS